MAAGVGTTVVGDGAVGDDARVSQHLAPDPTHGTTVPRLPRTWAALSAAAAGLSAIGALIALLVPGRIYAHETSALSDAATAQDLVGLIVVAPLVLVLTYAASRGSLRSWLCLLGCLSFTAYNYAIYAFSVHFGPLFLLWVAVLGLSLFALIGGLTSLPPGVLADRFAGASVRPAGWFLVVVAVFFALLWLREIVPDLVAGRSSTSAADWRVPTNPVHVLDLVFFLPSVVVSGVLLLRRQWFGYATAAGQLVFLGLTALPAIVTPVVTQARGRSAEWSVVAPLGIIVVATAGVLWHLLRTADARGD